VKEGKTIEDLVKKIFFKLLIFLFKKWRPMILPIRNKGQWSLKKNNVLTYISDVPFSNSTRYLIKVRITSNIEIYK